MARLDQRAAGLLALVLALTALIGFGQGLSQALRAPRPEQVAAGVDPSRDPVPSAAALTGPAMDEAHVRQIAREEAAAVVGTRRKAVAPKDDADDDAASAHSAASETPSITPPPTITTAPAAAAPPLTTPG